MFAYIKLPKGVMQWGYTSIKKNNKNKHEYDLNLKSSQKLNILISIRINLPFEFQFMYYSAMLKNKRDFAFFLLVTLVCHVIY